ncbi:hypothetical protein QYF61_016545 [Mycteria americana]|uniref:Uncharacterized protein n=1 Tax=Mycteria americana TaxID=33587 RepID=A0AAN7NAQ5_MYCAM|nr:hypothetical protein QYF61_016545 [Mycteria americana]
MLQHLNVSLVVRGPKLNTVFEVRPHQCRVQGHDHFPSPAGHTIPDTSQDAVGFLGHLGTLLAHIQAAVNKHPQVLLCQAAFQPLFPKPVALHGVAVAQVQDLALGLVEPHTIDLGPSIQPVQIPLQSLPTLKHINTPTQLGVIRKLTEGALDAFIQIIDKDVKQNWPQHRALGNTACDRPPTGVNSIHHHSLGLAIQPVLYAEKTSQASLLPRRLVFRHLGTARSCAFRTSSLKNVQPSWTPLPFRAASQGTLSTSLLNRPKSALRKSKVAVLLTPLAASPHIKNSYHFVITLPKTASNHHMAHKSFSVGEQQVQRGSFPRWLTHQLCQEVICHTLKEPPRLFLLCCIVFPADIWSLGDCPLGRKVGSARPALLTMIPLWINPRRYRAGRRAVPSLTTSLCCPERHVQFLMLGHFHASALFSHKYIINVDEDIAIKRETEALASQVGNGIHKNEFVQPKIEVIAEENPLDPIMQTQVLHHRGMQRFVGGQLLISVGPTLLYEAAPLVLGTHVLLGLSEHGSGKASWSRAGAQAAHALHT